MLNEAYARNKRLQPLSENLQKLQQASWEAEIVLGEDADKSLPETMKEYRKCWAELSFDISEYFSERYKQANNDTTSAPQYLEDLRKTVYGVPTDDFGKRVQNAEDRLSSALKAFVK